MILERCHFAYFVDVRRRTFENPTSSSNVCAFADTCKSCSKFTHVREARLHQTYRTSEAGEYHIDTMVNPQMLPGVDSKQ